MRGNKLKGVERGFYNICTRLKTKAILRSMEPEESTGQAVRSQLQQVVASAGFARNERLSRFLRFLVERHLEGRDSELKESLIAIEVFGRKPDYDPKLDAIVRTEAVRLRARLDKYYAGEGSADPVIIDLPKGGYTPRFRRVAAARYERKPRSPRLWRLAALAGLAVALAATGWWRFQHQNTPIPIAVLPLNNLSEDPGNDYFADGLTDEIIRNLSIIDGLAVRSQTSSFAFKGKPQNVREAGHQLEADYILEGSVLRAGQQVRINAQLVRVRDDFPVWSGRFDREVTDVLAIQDEISRGIVNSLRLKLGRGRRRYETSVEAYDLYLHARALEIQSGLSGWIQSIGPFEETIAKDPSFAPAYAGLAAAHAARSGGFDFDRADEMSKMRAAAEKAIQLDPLSAEAHDALGLVYARDAQWEQSEKSFRRAIELGPSRSESYNHFAMFLLVPLGRIEEALHQVRIAEKTDPLSPNTQAKLAVVLIAAGRYDEADGHCQKLPADHPYKSVCQGRVRLGQSRIGEAIQVLETAFNRGVPEGSQVRRYLGYAYARAGRREEAERLAASPNPVSQALIFAGLGDKDRTLEALDRMTVLGPVRIGREVINSPEFSLLRGDPRLQALRKKVGLPE
jgi:adenylate cyclase